MKTTLSVLLLCTGALACSKEQPPAGTAYDANNAPTATLSEPEPAPVAVAPGTDTTPRDGAVTAPNANDATAVAPSQNAAALPAPTNTKPDSAKTDTTKTDSPKPDNTKVNERDRSSAALTPLDQGNNESDLKITQQIRQAVQANDSLSFTAKNIKIITSGGKVTLRGPVNTAAERSAIEAAARKVTANVDNQLEIKK